MTEVAHEVIDLNSPEILTLLDDLSLWSAPFGIRLLDVIKYRKGIKALDIGCGLGFPLIELSMRLGVDSRVLGLDPWEAALGRVRQKFKSQGIMNAEVVAGVAEDMPFKNEFFDLIVSNNGINNVQNLERTLSECRRVSRRESQFAFTFNTNESFVEFYEIFRGILAEYGLREYNEKIDEHIYSKRKPLYEFKERLLRNGFNVVGVYEDTFKYRFADGTAALNHFFIRLAFLQSWREILPGAFRASVFAAIERKINDIALSSGGFSLSVPFLTLDCERV